MFRQKASCNSSGTAADLVGIYANFAHFGNATSKSARKTSKASLETGNVETFPVTFVHLKGRFTVGVGGYSNLISLLP